VLLWFEADSYLSSDPAIQSNEIYHSCEVDVLSIAIMHQCRYDPFDSVKGRCFRELISNHGRFSNANLYAPSQLAEIVLRMGDLGRPNMHANNSAVALVGIW